MSSRELVDELFGIVTEADKDGREWLVAADFLPERSAFNTALRGGDWSPEEYRQARLINEMATAYAYGRGYEMELSPAQEAAEKAHEEWQIDTHGNTLAQLRGERR